MEVDNRKKAATPVNIERGKNWFFENYKEEKKSINNSCTSTKSAASSGMKSIKSMSSLHNNSSSVTKKKMWNRSTSKTSRVNHPKGWGVR